MKFFYSLEELPDYNENYIAIGNFDGIHLAHQKIINNLIKLSNNNENLIITFKKPPFSILYPDKFHGYIFPEGWKYKYFENFGIKNVLILDFEKIKDFSAEIFIKMLLEKVKKLTLVVGYNFQFGKNKEANIDTLKELAKKHNFNLIVVDKIISDHIVISSSQIRNNIFNGNINIANKMLGRPFFIESTKIKGDGIGQNLGYPTINLKINEQVLPKFGVYFTLYYYNNNFYPSMTYIGTRPVVKGKDIRIETHVILDNYNNKEIFNNDKILLVFLERIRDEISFNNLEELKNFLYNDKVKILNLFEKLNYKILNFENLLKLKI